MKFSTQLTHIVKSLILILCLISNSAIHASGGNAHEDRGLYGTQSPDFPLNDYVNGKLGVINPNYRLSYLVIAYRYLSNKPLSKREQRNVLDAIAPVLTQFFNFDFQVDINQSNQEIARKIHAQETYHANSAGYFWWKEMHKLPINEQLQYVMSNYPENIKPFTKYKFASLRLKAIAQELDAIMLPGEQKDSIMQAWLNIQNQVFNKELDGDKARQAVKEITKEQLELLTLDADYLVAASYFNSDNEQSLLIAHELFTRLAKNERYPWHEWADYLSYRALTRVACPETNDMPRLKQKQLLAQALTGMHALAANAKDPAVKNAAIDYKDIIKSRLDRKGMILELVNTMNNRITRNNFHKMIFYNDLEGMISSSLLWDEMTEEESEILFWIFNYQSHDAKKTFPIAYEHWQKSPANSAWLLIALNNIKEANSSQQKELLKAASKVSSDHPGFFSIRSLLIQDIRQLEGNTPQSKLKRHKLIGKTYAQLKAGNDFSTYVHFAKKGIPLAQSIQDLLDYGFFIPSASMISTYPSEYETAHPYYSPIELSEALNYLPLSVLLKVIQSEKLPTLPKRELYASVWARAMILKRFTIADRIAKKAGELNPALKPLIQRSLKTKDPEQRLKILVRALLYFPELSPIIYLKNTWLPQFDNTPIYNGIKARRIRDSHSATYWCDKGEINRPIYDNQPRSEFTKAPWIGMLTATQQKELDKEQTQFNLLPNGAVWLLDKTYLLAKKYPKDPENAELLALAINLTRVMDCYNSNSLEARRAFYLLKKSYAQSEPEKRTQHHY